MARDQNAAPEAAPQGEPDGDADIAAYKSDTTEFLNSFRRYITDNFGEPCDEIEEECICCRLWKHFDDVTALVE